MEFLAVSSETPVAVARSLRRICAFVLLCNLWTTFTPAAGEYELKAAFLYKFASFVVWPRASRPGPVCIGVVGQDPFGQSLDRIVQNKTADGRPFRIRRFKAGDNVGGCEIVFISASERRRLPSILDALKREPVLTVGDVPEFGERGGVITLCLVGDHIHLQINLEAAERANLQLSSKLLSLASVIRGESVMGSSQ